MIKVDYIGNSQNDDDNLIALTKTRNETKRAETSQNQPKRPKKIAKRPETTQNFKIREVWHFLMAFVFQASSPNPKFGYFWSISINFLIITKFCLYPI